MAGRKRLLGLLGHLWLCLHCTAALRCHLMPLTQISFGWGPATDVQTCDELEVCQRTLLHIGTGPVVIAFGSKGCTLPGAQITGVSQYRRPPEVSITLYIHLCSTDLCNNDQISNSLWKMPADSKKYNSSDFVPGNLQCQVCAALESCPEDLPWTACPKAATRCYRGTINLITRNLSLPLAVWGCGSWTDCGLLDGFWTPGPIALTESCDDKEEIKNLLGRWTLSGSGFSPDPRLFWEVSLGSLLALWRFCLHLYSL